MSVMQINISDSEISGTGTHTTVSRNEIQSQKSNDIDALMSNLTTGKPSHGTHTRGTVHDGQAPDKKNVFFGGKK